MSAANSYAKALYEAAKENKVSPVVMDQLESEMELLQASLFSSKEAKVALTGPITTAKEKITLVEQLCRHMKLSDLATQFALLLARKRRLLLLPQIRDSFSSFRLTLEGGVAGRLVAAETMDQTDIETLAKAF